MRVLLTNNQLSGRTGTELYLTEVAEALLAAGHEPFAFSLTLGPLAEQLRARGIPVSDDLRALPVPEVIHGQHLIETTLAALTYRQVPVISFCHGPEAWQESGCALPNVVRWVAVDEACRQRLVRDEGIEPSRLSLVLNHYDERKFAPRGPLPVKPRRALLLSNYLRREQAAVQAVAEVCAERGIELVLAGAQFGSVVENVETLLPQFDLVFAKARTAIEALAVGCAVVQVEYFGAGRLVRAEIYEELRALNFGYRSMTYPLTADHVGREVDRYDAEDAGRVSARMRREGTLAGTMKQLSSLYDEARAMTSSLEPYEPMAAAADFLRFQLYLAKKPLETLAKVQGVPLRLPVGAIPPGEVAPVWERLAAAHGQGIGEVVDREQERLCAVMAERVESKARAREKIGKLETKVERLRGENAELRARYPKFRRLRRLLGMKDE